MRYLSFLAAVLVSAPACAADQTIELRPGFAERWQAPRPFAHVYPGNDKIVKVVQGQTDQELIIIAEPDGGTTNIVLTDNKGEQVANVLVTTAPRYQPARSAATGGMQLYRDDDKCHPDCKGK
jgi:Flp pilus assembly secretin CpaC